MDFKENALSFTAEQMVAYYENLSDVHIKRETDLNEESVTYILENIVGETVLDIACGRGYLANKIVAHLPVKVTGIDFIINEAFKKSINPTFLVGNIEQIPFPDNHFDTVICTHTLEHIIDIQKGIAELRRVCKKKLIIVLPKQREYKYTFDLHLHFFPYEFSVLRLLDNKYGHCFCIKNDWVYTEEKVI
ncbi:MAG: class I SAM-dependent methyltransferase [Saprospirales bacterium]|nr:class I SAM-dependent methyltransferase [Saprospirales bacterium]